MIEIWAAYNEQFSEIAGVFPLKRHHGFATSSPAAISVLAASLRGAAPTAGKTKIENGRKNF